MHATHPLIKIFSLISLLLFFGQSVAKGNNWHNPQGTHFISPYDFNAQGKVERKIKLESFIGKGKSHHLREFYNNLNDVYADFNLNPNLVMSCPKRHEQFAKKKWNTQFKKNAENYFCRGNFDTSYCHENQKGKVYLDYCLDLGDTFDWVAIQSAFLNAQGRVVIIPPNKEFHVNQSLIMPDGLNVNWLSSEDVSIALTKNKALELKNPQVSNDGTYYERFGASFIKFVPQNEPINLDQPRKTGFSVGTMFKVARIEKGIDCKSDAKIRSKSNIYGFAPYSGISASIREPNRIMAKYSKTKIPDDITIPCNEGIVKNITLSYPHVDVNNIVGENGISFGLGAGGNFKMINKSKVGPLKIYGGIVKNVKINTYKRTVKNKQGNNVRTSKGVVGFAGGKAIQCEAGCRGLDIRSLTIINSDIGINSNALSRLYDPEDRSKILANYERLNLFGPGMTSQVHVLGLRTVNVDSPVNVANTINKDNSQEVKIDQFYFYNSGSGKWADGRRKKKISDTSSKIKNGVIQGSSTPSLASAKDGGIITSRNGKNIEMTNGVIFNEIDYLGVPELLNIINIKDVGDFDNDQDFSERLLADPVKTKNISYSTRYRKYK